MYAFVSDINCVFSYHHRKQKLLAWSYSRDYPYQARHGMMLAYLCVSRARLCIAWIAPLGHAQSHLIRQSTTSNSRSYVTITMRCRISFVLWLCWARVLLRIFNRTASPRYFLFISLFLFEPPSDIIDLDCVALQDKNTRFDLAIECGNVDVALEMAKAVDWPECWEQLAQQVLKQGNHNLIL